MSKGNHSFRHNDAARLIRATKAAGLKVKGVTLRDGKPYVETDDQAAADASEAAKANPVDQVLKNDQDQKRPA
jgi:hypothetical protein